MDNKKTGMKGSRKEARIFTLAGVFTLFLGTGFSLAVYKSVSALGPIFIVLGFLFLMIGISKRKMTDDH